jgi:cholesterol 7-dehydrogenase
MFKCATVGLLIVSLTAFPRTGRSHDPPLPRHRRIRPVKRRRPTPEAEAARLATYPPPYPDSWYVLCRSEDVTDKVVSVEALGQRFVVFRDDGGKAAVLDSHCPHLGADLGLGNVVDGCIECPFHRWRFGADGRLAAPPYGQTHTPNVRTRSWPVDEVYGMVLIYFSTRPDTPPPHPFPRYEDVDDGQLIRRGQHDPEPVAMHLIEFAENSVDFQHFAPLHGKMTIPWTNVTIPGVRIHHDATWEPDPDEAHVAWFRDKAVLEIFGRVRHWSRASAAIRFIGPGGVVAFTFDIPDRGRVLMFHTHTPLAPLSQQVRFTWFSARPISKLLASYIVGNWVSQWRADIAIWETKIYRTKPKLNPEDGPIHELRRWFQQFYPAEVVHKAAAGNGHDAAESEAHPTPPADASAGCQPTVDFGV